MLWIKLRLQYSIKNEYDKSIERYKKELENKKRSELIASLFSEWLSCPIDRKELNRLTFEAFLWLPDDIAKELSATLSHQEDAESVRKILLRVRNFLLEGTDLDENEIIIFRKVKT